MASAPESTAAPRAPFGSTTRGRRTDLTFIGVRRAINEILKCLENYGDQSMDNNPFAAIYFGRMGVTKRQFIKDNAPARTPGGVHELSPTSKIKKGIQAIEDQLKQLVIPLDKLGDKAPEFKITGDERTKHQNLVVWYRIYEAAMVVSQTLRAPYAGRERTFEEKQPILNALKKLVKTTNGYFERLGPHSRLRPMLEDIQSHFCFQIPGTDIVSFEGASVSMADDTIAVSTAPTRAAASTDIHPGGSASSATTATATATAHAESSTALPAPFNVDAYLKGTEPITFAAACKVFDIEADLLASLSGTRAGAAAHAIDYGKTIKDHYRTLAKKYHPDKGAEDAAAFQKMKALYELVTAYSENPGIIEAVYQFETAHLPELERLTRELGKCQSTFAANLTSLTTAIPRDLPLDLTNFRLLGAAKKEATIKTCEERTGNINDLDAFFDETEAFYRDLEERYHHIADEVYQALKNRLYHYRGGADSDEDAVTEEIVDTTLARLMRGWESPLVQFDELLTTAAQEFNAARTRWKPAIEWETRVGQPRRADVGTAATGSARPTVAVGSEESPGIGMPSGGLAQRRAGRLSGSTTSEGSASYQSAWVPRAGNEESSSAPTPAKEY